MSKLSENFDQLVKQAEMFGKIHMLETGIMPPQESAMFATIWTKINELEALVKAKECSQESTAD